MSNDLVSIIIPIFNVEKYLCKCIDSAIAQTYKNIEIILIDDGSQDGSKNICDEYSKKYENIEVIHKENGGLSDARNVGIEEAAGKYLFFLDADDYIDKDTIFIMYSRLVDSSADLAICNFYWIGENGEGLNKEAVLQDELLKKTDLFDKILQPMNTNYIIACNKLYKKELFNNLRFRIGKYHEDEFLIHYLFALCSLAVCIKTPLYYYMQRENSITTEFSESKTKDCIEALSDRVKFFHEKEMFVGEQVTLVKLLNYIINKYEDIYYKNRKNPFLLYLVAEYKKIYFSGHYNKLDFKMQVCLILFLVSPKIYSLFKKAYRKIIKE